MKKTVFLFQVILILGFLTFFHPLPLLTLEQAQEPVTQATPVWTWTMPEIYLNQIDFSGIGEVGWGRVYRRLSGTWYWDQKWNGAYRHDNFEAWLSQYNDYGTQLDADRGGTSGDYARAFYQYHRIDTGHSSGGYMLHLDFDLREDSSTTASSVDNWEIMILSDKHASWQEPLFREQLPNCDEHGTFKNQVFDIYLEDHVVYLLIGHWDSWTADWSQGHTKYFYEISAAYATPNYIRGGPFDEVIHWNGDCLWNLDEGIMYVNSYAGPWQSDSAIVQMSMEFTATQRAPIRVVWDANVIHEMECDLGSASLVATMWVQMCDGDYVIYSNTYTFYFESVEDPNYSKPWEPKYKSDDWSFEGLYMVTTFFAEVGYDIKVMVSFSCSSTGTWLMPVPFPPFVIVMGGYEGNVWGDWVFDDQGQYLGDFAYLQVTNVEVYYEI